MTLIPQLYQVKGQGETNDVKELDVELKMKGGRQEVDYAIEIGSLIMFEWISYIWLNCFVSKTIENFSSQLKCVFTSFRRIYLFNLKS